MVRDEESLVCPNCGSKEIVLLESTGEMYCKKCGTILEEELLRA